MTWCAVCSYHSSFVEGCIHVSVPCDSFSLSADCLVASILKWVTADVCMGLWVSNGWPVVVCVVATQPKQFRGCVATEDPNLTEGGRLEERQLWTKAPKVSDRLIVSGTDHVSGLADSCFFVCCSDVTAVESRPCSLQVASSVFAYANFRSIKKNSSISCQNVQFCFNPARRTILYIAPCSGIRGTYKRE
jgi:hypothetical protein